MILLSKVGKENESNMKKTREIINTAFWALFQALVLILGKFS